MELGKRLITNHGFEITVFVVPTTTATTTTDSSDSDSDSDTTKSNILQPTSNLNSLNIIVTPHVDISHKLDPNDPCLLGLRIILTMIESLPFIRSQILSMKIPPSVLIVDLFSAVALSMARDLHMSSYVFFATSAWFSALSIYLPFFTMEEFLNHANNQEPLLIPGCEPLRFEDTLPSFSSPCGPIHKVWVDGAKELVLADGILMNTWQDLEPTNTKAFTENGLLGRLTKGPVYAIGPLVRTGEPEERREGGNFILRWLDRHPKESVIFLSFGSGGTMSKCQMRELAYGLELSKQRFIWVVRPPMEDDASAAFFDAVKGVDESTMANYFPEGFLSRTKEVGLCVPMWAPQDEILKHPATGGFVTHCGWNSVLESILSGVPMVAWPLYAEQKMNATMLSEELGVAVKVKKTMTKEGEIVCREQIGDLIRRVMVDEEGVDIRVKVKGYKLSGENAFSMFGSSHESLCQLAKDCELHLHQNFETKALGV
jgi:coniferyl-alcohol glucosyltransferase